MSDHPSWFRSPRLLDQHRSACLVVDVQESLVPKVLRPAETVWNISRLVRGARALGVITEATEQYPQGLKSTVPELIRFFPVRHAKISFSIASLRPLFAALSEQNISQLVLCGIETHICMMQSALDLLSEGFEVQVVADATSARGECDHLTGLDRMRDEGVTITTTETALFEWCQGADNKAFKAIRELIIEDPPFPT